MSDDILAGIRSNDTNSISQIITAVENSEPTIESDLNRLYPYSQEAVRIGITGPPGAGKSTLIDKLISEFRQDGKSVGCITVDPTSPFSGGALLGDRVRMNRHTMDSGVFIRSMGSRGEMGGLAKKTKQVADVLAASGKDILLFETVGIGQVGMEIVKNVDVTIVVLVPEAGDEIQFMKAGPVEIGDLFVINKADREGADGIARSLRHHLENGPREREYLPKILLSVASTGVGIWEIYQECLTLITSLKKSGIFYRRRKLHYLAQIRSMVKDKLVSNFWNNERNEMLNLRVDEFHDQKLSPYDAATILMKSMSE